MMKTISIPPLNLPTMEFASQGNALLGIKGSGKSYGATYLAERLMDAGIPIIAFDPIGTFVRFTPVVVRKVNLAMQLAIRLILADSITPWENSALWNSSRAANLSRQVKHFSNENQSRTETYQIAAMRLLTHICVTVGMAILFLALLIVLHLAVNRLLDR
jgi:hypothetical protein